MVKAEAPKRFLLTVAYPVYSPDVAVAKDGKIDVAAPNVVEQACWDFMGKGCRLGMWHEDGFDDCAVVKENYIYRNPQPWVQTTPAGKVQVIMQGDWLVGSVLTKSTWRLYESGLIGGVSVQGTADRLNRPTQQTVEEIRRRRAWQTQTN